MITLVSIIFSMLLCVEYVHAYDVETHAAITMHAYENSVLQDTNILFDFDVDNSSISYKDYIDFGDTGIELRASYKSFEDRKILDLDAKPESIQGWLMRGVIREDDWPTGPNPKDDPVNSIRSAVGWGEG